MRVPFTAALLGLAFLAVPAGAHAATNRSIQAFDQPIGFAPVWTPNEITAQPGDTDPLALRRARQRERGRCLPRPVPRPPGRGGRADRARATSVRRSTRRSTTPGPTRSTAPSTGHHARRRSPSRPVTRPRPSTRAIPGSPPPRPIVVGGGPAPLLNPQTPPVLLETGDTVAPTLTVLKVTSERRIASRPRLDVRGGRGLRARHARHADRVVSPPDRQAGRVLDRHGQAPEAPRALPPDAVRPGLLGPASPRPPPSPSAATQRLRAGLRCSRSTARGVIGLAATRGPCASSPPSPRTVTRGRTPLGFAAARPRGAAVGQGRASAGGTDGAASRGRAGLRARRAPRCGREPAVVMQCRIRISAAQKRIRPDAADDPRPESRDRLTGSGVVAARGLTCPAGADRAPNCEQPADGERLRRRGESPSRPAAGRAPRAAAPRRRAPVTKRRGPRRKRRGPRMKLCPPSLQAGRDVPPVTGSWSTA